VLQLDEEVFLERACAALGMARERIAGSPARRETARLRELVYWSGRKLQGRPASWPACSACTGLGQPPGEPWREPARLEPAFEEAVERLEAAIRGGAERDRRELEPVPERASTRGPARRKNADWRRGCEMATPRESIT